MAFSNKNSQINLLLVFFKTHTDMKNLRTRKKNKKKMYEKEISREKKLQSDDSTTLRRIKY